MRNIEIIHFPQDEGKKYMQFRYPAGEVQVRFNPSCLQALSEADEVYVYAKITDGEIMALAQLTNVIRGAVDASTYQVLILPYLPYARADRRFVLGDCNGLAAYAQLINSLGYDKVISLDVHSPSAYRINTLKNVSPLSLIGTVLSQIPDPVVLLPDSGASRYGLSNALYCTKSRDSITGELSNFVVPPRKAFGDAKSVLIVDDICDGGGTFTGIADAMKDYGLPLYLYVTHGIFSKGFEELNKRFYRIYTTDSFIEKTEDPRVSIIPCEGLIRGELLSTPELWRTQ